MSTREDLVNDIQRFVGGQREYAERMAGWIIEDRKRVVSPLMQVNIEDNIESAIEHTLNNAGLGA